MIDRPQRDDATWVPRVWCSRGSIKRLALFWTESSNASVVDTKATQTWDKFSIPGRLWTFYNVIRMDVEKLLRALNKIPASFQQQLSDLLHDHTRWDSRSVEFYEVPSSLISDDVWIPSKWADTACLWRFNSVSASGLLNERLEWSLMQFPKLCMGLFGVKNRHRYYGLERVMGQVLNSWVHLHWFCRLCFNRDFYISPKKYELAEVVHKIVQRYFRYE